ncbi:hypothetical protein POVWA1_028480 [Plasmodium ovale wallikeri]|uniref:Uncharacterized protein n=1 Tax=Plasmodium ovale wallikeri TaxID=864142 RepID=A0A1A8YVQ7_PLAOA|nr:hypothetical protein POVWA1_028480 [Plasmodium ovale wallikeri]
MTGLHGEKTFFFQNPQRTILESKKKIKEKAHTTKLDERMCKTPTWLCTNTHMRTSAHQHISTSAHPHIRTSTHPHVYFFYENDFFYILVS